MNKSNVSGGRNKSRMGGRTPPSGNRGNKSMMEISIDHEYIEKVDAMEKQNRIYQLEIEKLKAAKDEER